MRYLKFLICVSFIMFIACSDDKELWESLENPENPNKSALYMGLVGYSNEICINDIKELNNSSKKNFDEFIDGITFQSGNNYELALENALDQLENFNSPQDLSEVMIVSFVTGFDDENKLNQISSRLKSTQILGNNITSYAIGYNDGTIGDSDMKNVLNKISSSSDNVFIIKKSDNLNENFTSSFCNLSTDINKRLIDGQKLTISIPMQSDNTRIRICMDKKESTKAIEDIEEVYIEGTYSKGTNTLKDIICKGVIGLDVREIKCTEVNSRLTFTFDKIKINRKDPEIKKSDIKISYYISITNTWGDDYNFDSNKSVQIEYIRKSGIILFLFSCNSSLNNIEGLKEDYKDFVGRIKDNIFIKMWQIVDDSQDVTNSGQGSVDPTVLKGELQSALTDTKSSVVATSAHGYQYSNANSVDVFAGYMTVSRSDFQYGPALNNTYQWPNGYYGSAMSMGPTGALYNTYTYAESLGVPEYKAIAQIVYAITALRAVNNTGCVPYEDNRALKVSRPLKYSSQEETYDLILADLNEAIKTLKERQPDKEALMPIEGEAYDKGDATLAYSEYRWEKWVQLANTIKLRIALYLSKPDPTEAQKIATEVSADEIGLLVDDFGPAWKQGNTQHPIYQISASKDGGWADSRMSASAENILKRTGSPLIAKFFTKNIDKISGIGTGADKGKGAKKEADYYGIRQGTNVGIKTTGQGYYNFSEVSVAFKYVRLVWVCKEEVIFMKAEAALRWGLFGDPKALYEEGVRSALAKYELAGEADKYLAQTAVVQKKVAGKVQDIDYIDPYNNKNSLPGRLNICVAWDDSDDMETKLEKLMTQKWIAIFPNGYEAWTDYRRTGYPRLFPSVQAWQGSPSFPVELQLRRIPHDEADENIELYDLPNIEKALTIFGVPGQNAGGQRLYFEGDPTKYPWTYDAETGWPIPKNF